MDFMDRLRDRINEIPNLPLTCERGYLGTGESLVIYPIPGSRVIQSFMNGTSDQQLNYEIAMQSKVQGSIHRTLWEIQTELENLTELESNNNSFKFEETIISNKPFINQADDQGWITFLLNVQANITVLKEE